MEFKLNEHQTKVWEDRYKYRDEKTIQDTFHRVATAVASVEASDLARVQWESAFFRLLNEGKFLAGGRILANAGTGNDTTLYNCYVIPSPEDSRKGILDNIKLMADIMARGGGVGVDLSSIRPRGEIVKSVNGTASGPVSWANAYSVITGDVIQQGGTRRGALMVLLRDNHPDIEEFITAKRETGKLQYCNMSVAISDEFISAVKNDADWKLSWNGKVYKTIKAKDLWNLICESAWSSGEPGCLFINRIRRWNNTSYYEEIIGVNPCGEQPLPAYGVCNLGSLNLTAFVRHPDDYSSGSPNPFNPLERIGDCWFDYKAFKAAIRTAVRFLDNVIDATPYALEQNEVVQKAGRRIGLGTMGLADALILMGVRYGSSQALDTIESIYSTLRNEAYQASVYLAIEKSSFPMFDREKYTAQPFIESLPIGIKNAIYENGIRNAVILSEAPTGTISQLVGVSSGIEPNYAWYTKRLDRLGIHNITHPLVEAWKLYHPKDPLPSYFVKAKELTVFEHADVQITIQKYTDASISKTCNAPNNHTPKDVSELYLYAYDKGAKGVTYFREGSREGVLEDDERASTQGEHSDCPKVEQDDKPLPVNVSVLTAPPTAIERPKSPLRGKTYQVRSPLEDGGSATLYVTITEYEGKPFEIFLNSGIANRADHDIIARALSQSLRHGVPVDEVIDNCWKVRGYTPIFGFGKRPITCVANAIGYCLSDFQETMRQKTTVDGVHDESTSVSIAEVPSDAGTAKLCPQCGTYDLIKRGGCTECRSCGYQGVCGE